MHHRSHGFGTRYDNSLDGNHIDREREKSSNTGVYLNYNKRFCETCQTAKPRNKYPAAKGWKCDDCLNSAASKAKP